jgi:hypothetical protein
MTGGAGRRVWLEKNVQAPSRGSRCFSGGKQRGGPTVAGGAAHAHVPLLFKGEARAGARVPVDLAGDCCCVVKSGWSSAPCCWLIELIRQK